MSRTQGWRGHRTERRGAAGLLLAVLAVSGCGLRVGDSQVRAATAAAEGNGAGPSSLAAGSSGAGAPGSPSSGGLTGGLAGAGGGPGTGGGTGPSAIGSTSAPTGVGAGPSTGTASGPGVTTTTAPAGGNGGATDTGVTATGISIGNVSDLGGPVPGLFQGGPYGAQAYFDYVNSQGGVYGRKLKLITADDGLQCGQNEAAYQNLVGTVFGFVGSWSLDDNCGAQILRAHADIPLTNEALTPQSAALPGEFSEAPFGQGAPLGPFLYLKSKFPGVIGSVGTLVGNQAAAVAAWGYTKKAMESLGYKVIYEDDFPPAQSNFEPDVVRMRAAGVKMVYLIALNAPDAANFAAEAQQQNWHPQVFACAVCYTASYIQAAGGAAATNGTYLNVGASLFLGQDGPSVPEVGTYLHWLQSDYPKFSPDQFSAYSWANAALFVQALRAAGPHVTRKAVSAALAGIHGFNDNGLMAPADTGAKRPSNCYLMLQIQNGNYVKVDDPTTGFRCDAPYFRAG